jgi:hypothetical protein
MRRVLVIAVVVLTAACGVRPTGVISAGDPAAATQAAPLSTVYLVRQRKLVPVQRSTFPGAPQTAIYALQQGPNPIESAQGMRSPLMYLQDLRAALDRGVLTVSYGDDTPASMLTVGQIVCSGTAQPGVEAVVIVRNGADLVRGATCEQFKQYLVD